MLQVLEVTEPSSIGALFTNVNTVVNKIMALFVTVGNELLKNPIFQIMIGIVMLGILFGLVFVLVHKLKTKGR